MISDEDSDEEETPWTVFFMESSSPYYGWVKDVETANSLISEFSLYTSTSNAMPRCTRNFGIFSLNGEELFLYSFVVGTLLNKILEFMYNQIYFVLTNSFFAIFY